MKRPLIKKHYTVAWSFDKDKEPIEQLDFDSKNEATEFFDNIKNRSPVYVTLWSVDLLRWVDQ